MKAILIIEVNDNADLDEAKADITMQEDKFGQLKGQVGKKWYKNISLKPLPNYKKENMKYGYGEEYEMGYDDCLDEILGEEKCSQ